MYQVSAQLRLGTEELTKAEKDNAQATKEVTSEARRAADSWHDYYTAVSREGIQFTNRMGELQFRQTQAAEDAAFRLDEIERDAAQQREDLLAKQWLDEEDELEKHQMKMRWMYEDHLDALRDLEYDHQQDRKELLEQAPWWVRYALQKEFAERERIARTGDKKALAEYDAALNKRIEAIDPAYAKELRQLDQRYKHEKQIETRENKQALRRDQEQFNQENRAQQRQLDYQLRVIERELEDQRRAWEFHDRQRRENEARAMDELITQHNQKLDQLWEDTNYKLSQLPNLYYQYGYQNAVKYTQGWEDAQHGSQPNAGELPTGDGGAGPKRHQAGAWMIPHNELALLHRGEMVIPAGPAERIREGGLGGITIGELHLHGNYTPFLARKMAKELADQLGPMINQRSR
jgi:hypothetical protein